MKQLKYGLSIIASTACIAVPLFMFLYMILTAKWNLILPLVIVLAACLILAKVLSNIRIKTRQDVEYDEFGRSKTKTYERLSKAERDAIDLQKTANMELILNSTAIHKMTKPGSAEPEKDMSELVGLEPVKQRMREMAARMEFESGKKKSMSGRHMVFYGSPGTGKTTVARILTGFLYKYKYIDKNKCVEVDGNFLKAGPDTAVKTEAVIRQAYGGVLFIDEAYALIENGDGTGDAAVAALIKQMEDNRDRFILILAGYTDEMQTLIAGNPGFESRIKEYLDFPDYDGQEMREIFSLMAKNEGFKIRNDVWEAYDERVEKERKMRSFGNGRTARNILDETLDRHSLNFIEGRLEPGCRYVICGADISREPKRKGFCEEPGSSFLKNNVSDRIRYY